jgi:hypothetical protein
VGLLKILVAFNPHLLYNNSIVIEKGKKMSFEKSVLSVVSKTLGDVPAGFTCGSLFVECSVPEAVKLETALLKEVRCGIILSRVGAESAYDFV